MPDVSSALPGAGKAASASASAAAAAAAAGDSQRERARLTEQEKKNNHIASEQKRREAIRAGFDRLASIVPGMEGQGRSEAVVLNATVQYIRDQMAEREELLAIAKERGLDVSQYELNPKGSG